MQRFGKYNNSGQCNEYWIIIPDSVTSIGSSAFSGCSGLTSIIIPESVTSIGDDVFYDCSGLTSITIPFVGGKADGSGETYFGYIFGAYSYNYNDNYVPASLKEVIITGGTSIENSAFYGCSGLTSIIIPNSVTRIGYDAFSGCSNLIKIETDAENPNYFSQNGILYSRKNTEFVHIPAKLQGDITIADGIVTIFDNAFSGRSGLTSVIIPDSVTSIGSGAFEGCSGLTSIIVKEGNIKYHSSGNCLIETETQTLILGCQNSIIPNDGSVTSIGYMAFYDCSGLTSIIIPDSVTSIGYYAFSGCSGLTSVIIPDSVTSIGYYAFRYCSGLTSVIIPDSVTSIGESAFYGCSGLTSIIIPNSVTSIGNYAFRYCSGLTSVIIPDSVTSIGESAFSGCSGLTSIIIPNSVTSIGSYAFRYCSGLTSVIIPDSVTSIGYNAFDGCSGLTIYCGAESKPSGWDSYWNPDNRPVIWGYKNQ